MRQARQGVQVALVYDAIESIDTSAAFFDRLRSAGVLVCAVNPINPLAQRKADADVTTRDHGNLLVVDNAAAFTGGINISSDDAPPRSGAAARAGRGRTRQTSQMMPTPTPALSST